MFEGEYELSLEEEAEIEKNANIYSIVRTLDFIEWAYNSSLIAKDVYFDNSNTILDQYNTSKEALEKFAGIDVFAQKYNLTDYKLGINRIKQGPAQISSSSTNTVKLINL